MIEIRWDWILNHLDDVVDKTWQHLILLVIPMLIGFGIAFVLAVLAMRRPGTVGPVTAVTGLLYTIPSLAAFAVLIPITGLTLTTAIIPLTTYTLLILYVNTVAGLRSVAD
jgi:osmoprotectant transport system permease protein